MDTLDHYRQIIHTVLQPYTKITYANVEVRNLAAFDTETDQYVIPSEGWDHHQHHHGCLIHIEIRDSTGDGTATELTNAGISKDAIGLGFQELRQTSYRFRCSLNR